MGFRAFWCMATMFRPDTPAKCCSYCGSREHDYEECPKRKADTERQNEGPADRSGMPDAGPNRPLAAQHARFAT